MGQSRSEDILENILGSNNVLSPPESRFEAILFSMLNRQNTNNTPVSSIEVTTPPSKTIYNDGETIDFTGIEVAAYKDDGSLLGYIPFSQLEFPVTIAHKSD